MTAKKKGRKKMILEPEQFAKGKGKRQSIPSPSFEQLYVAPFHDYEGGLTYQLYGLDYEGRVWRFRPGEVKWESIS